MVIPYTFDAMKVRQNIVAWLRDMKEKTGLRGVVIGISGGKDSTVAAALCAEAFGKENVHGLLMPNGEQSDIADSYRVCDAIGINYEVINIKPAYDALVGLLGDVTDEARVNIPPRVRMTTLYAYGQTHGLRVCGTGNLCERYVGYFTKWGDGACDFNPLGELTVKEVVAIGDTYDNIPSDLIHKIPTDGLWGQSDEERLGVTYEDIHNFIRLAAEVDPETKEKIRQKNKYALHKLDPIPIFVPIGH